MEGDIVRENPEDCASWMTEEDKQELFEYTKRKLIKHHTKLCDSFEFEENTLATNKLLAENIMRWKIRRYEDEIQMYWTLDETSVYFMETRYNKARREIIKKHIIPFFNNKIRAKEITKSILKEIKDENYPNLVTELYDVLIEERPTAASVYGMTVGQEIYLKSALAELAARKLNPRREAPFEKEKKNKDI